MKTINCKTCDAVVIILEKGSKIMTGSKIEVYCNDCKPVEKVGKYEKDHLPEGFEILFPGFRN